jgi:hypothetical protein
MFHRVDTMDDSDNGIASSTFGRGESNKPPAETNRNPEFVPSEPPLHPRQQWGSATKRRLDLFGQALKGDFSAVIGAAAGVHRTPESYGAWKAAGHDMDRMKDVQSSQEYTAKRRQQVLFGGELTNASRVQVIGNRGELHPLKVEAQEAYTDRAKSGAAAARARAAVAPDVAAAQASAAQQRARGVGFAAEGAATRAGTASVVGQSQAAAASSRAAAAAARAAKAAAPPAPRAKPVPAKAAKIDAAKKFLGL